MSVRAPDTPDDSSALFERCLAVGGVAVFPADTVYGLACDPGNRIAVERLYRLKRRPLAKPSAVMFFDLSLALAALPELGHGRRVRFGGCSRAGSRCSSRIPQSAFHWPVGRTRGRWDSGCRSSRCWPASSWPILQSSANRAGEPDARRLTDVPQSLRTAADLLLDGGELPGTPSTVIDLRAYEDGGSGRSSARCRRRGRCRRGAGRLARDRFAIPLLLLGGPGSAAAAVEVEEIAAAEDREQQRDDERGRAEDQHAGERGERNRDE